MSLPRFIGLHGLARSGKDTVAAVLAEEFGYRRVAFGDELKADLYKINPPISAALTLQEYVDAVGWDAAKEYERVRTMLQVYGTEVARAAWGEDCWIVRAKPAILAEYHRDPTSLTVITDVRFDNEATYIRGIGGKVVHVVREGAGLPGKAAEHVSEAGVSPELIDITLRNGGNDIDELRAAVRGLVCILQGAPALPRESTS